MSLRDKPKYSETRYPVAWMTENFKRSWKVSYSKYSFYSLLHNQAGQPEGPAWGTRYPDTT